MIAQMDNQLEATHQLFSDLDTTAQDKQKDIDFNVQHQPEIDDLRSLFKQLLGTQKSPEESEAFLMVEHTLLAARSQEYLSPVMQLLCRLFKYKLPMDVVSGLFLQEYQAFREKDKANRLKKQSVIKETEADSLDSDLKEQVDTMNKVTDDKKGKKSKRLLRKKL